MGGNPLPGIEALEHRDPQLPVKSSLRFQLLPIGPRLGILQRQLHCRSRHGRGSSQLAHPVSQQPLNFSSDCPAMAFRNLQVATRLGTNVRPASNRHEGRGRGKGLFHRVVGKARPVPAHMVPPANGGAVAGIVRPQNPHPAVTILRCQNRKTVINRSAALKAESTPLVARHDPSVSPEVRPALPPGEMHRLAILQRHSHRLRHLLEGEIGIARHPLFLLRSHPSRPQNPGVTNQAGRIVGMSGCHHQSFRDNSFPRETLRQPRLESCRDPAIVKNHDRNRILISDHHRTRPQPGIDSFQLGPAASVAGKNHRVTGSNIHLGRTHLYQSFVSLDRSHEKNRCNPGQHTQSEMNSPPFQHKE